jgi:hypothetical protein
MHEYVNGVRFHDKVQRNQFEDPRTIHEFKDTMMKNTAFLGRQTKMDGKEHIHR